MKKKLLFILVFLSTPILGIDYWNQIKRWITQNPSGAPAVAGEQVTELPALPADIQINEVIKKLIEISRTRGQAQTLIRNYALVNKEIAAFVKNNKIQLQKLLNQKFGIAPAILASGNYTDPEVKADVLDTLKHILKNIKEGMTANTLRSLVNAIEDPKKVITDLDLEAYLQLFAALNRTENYYLSTIVIGAINNFYNNNRTKFSSNIELDFISAIMKSLGEYGKKHGITTVLNYMFNTALKIFGPNFINVQTIHDQKLQTLLDYAKFLKNQKAIEYLETINKLNR